MKKSLVFFIFLLLVSFAYGGMALKTSDRRFIEQWNFSGDVEAHNNWDVFSNNTSTDLDADGTDVVMAITNNYTAYHGYFQSPVNTINQYVKIKVSEATLHPTAGYQTYGASLRQANADGSGDHYTLTVQKNNTSDVYFQVNTKTGTTNAGDPETVGSVVINVVNDNDWIGFSVTGTGTDTEFKYWDFGSSDPGAFSSWPAYTQMLDGNPNAPRNTGAYVGFRMYYHTDNAYINKFDVWEGGDQ